MEAKIEMEKKMMEPEKNSNASFLLIILLWSEMDGASLGREIYALDLRLTLNRWR